MSATQRTASINGPQQSSRTNYALLIQQDISGVRNDLYSSSTATQGYLDKLYRKLTWRLMPLLMLMLGLNYLDRTSLAFASIQMTQELQFTPQVYGLASGLFFLTYCAMQVPANFICMRLGVQKWFSGMMLVWGLTAASFATVKTPGQFYALRLLLGLAEAGSFPGVWYAISQWFPPHRIAFPYSLMAASVALSQIIAAPIAAALLKLDGVLGLSGWQWVFLGEGVPSVVLALCVPLLLPDGPEHMVQQGFAGLLSEAELDLLSSDGPLKGHARCVKDCSAGSIDPLDPDYPTSTEAPRPGPLRSLLQVAKVWQIWYLAVVNMFKDIANFALMMWLPVMVNSLLSGVDPTQLVTSQNITTHTSVNSQTGDDGTTQQASAADTGFSAVLLSTIPFTAAAIAVTLSGIVAQKTGKTILLIMVPNFIGGVSFMCFSTVVRWSRAAGFICLVVALSGAYASSPHAPIILAQLFASPLAATALPLYNSVAMLGGFAGPSIMGFLVQHLNGFGIATTVMGANMIVAGCMAAVLCCTKLHNRCSVDECVGVKNKPTSRYRQQAPAVTGDGYELVNTSIISS